MAATAKKKPLNKGLGRGLDALLAAGAPDADGGAAGAERLPIEFLKPAADQPRRRFDDDAIDELAASIRSHGLLQPILVRPVEDSAYTNQMYEIVAGERRWRAAQRAKLHDVPVIVKDISDEEAGEIALIENVQRVDLNPIEEATAYRKLIKTHGRKQDDIARAVGKSRSHIANILRLLKLPASAREALSAGAITMGHARALLSGDDPERLCEIVLRRNLSVRETERLAQGVQPAKKAGKGSQKSAGKKRSKDADTRALENDLSAVLGLDVEIDHSTKGGSVVIKYLDLDQLDDICRRLMGAGV